jgi:hypothetical protein
VKVGSLVGQGGAVDVSEWVCEWGSGGGGGGDEGEDGGGDEGSEWVEDKDEGEWDGHWGGVGCRVSEGVREGVREWGSEWGRVKLQEASNNYYLQIKKCMSEWMSEGVLRPGRPKTNSNGSRRFSVSAGSRPAVLY